VSMASSDQQCRALLARHAESDQPLAAPSRFPCTSRPASHRLLQGCSRMAHCRVLCVLCP
jgi:hypothetical protein